METTLGIPSIWNDIVLVFESNRPMNTITRPFCFVDEDSCGNQTPIDISSYDFDLIITLNGCDYFLGSTLSGELVKGTGDDNCKLWIDIETLTLDRGQYDYKVYFTDGVSVIKGKLEVE
jgi:hypothetical protein